MSHPDRTKTRKFCAIAQSNYIPWKGYFDLINSVDEYLIFDTVQYTRRDFRNRQQIQTSQGPKWLSIPLQTKGNYLASINQMQVIDSSWAMEHWKTIEHSYSKAPHFKTFKTAIKESYEKAAKEEFLTTINFIFLQDICQLLGIKTKLSFDSDYKVEDGKSFRLLSLCQQIGATDYISGPAAKCYLDVEMFDQACVEVHWMNYENYPVYEQIYHPFKHEVSILDLLFSCGEDAKKYMKTFSNNQKYPNECLTSTKTK